MTDSKKKPYRLMFRFWLDLEKEEEAKIADTIELLKNQRLFSSTIRNGIRLINDLRKGKLDVLFELFPWVQAEFMHYITELQATPTETEEIIQPAVQQQTVHPHIQSQLDRIEQLMQQQVTIPASIPQIDVGQGTPSGSASFKQLNEGCA